MKDLCMAFYSSRREAFRAGARLLGYKTDEEIDRVLKEAVRREEEVVAADPDSRMEHRYTREAEVLTIMSPEGKKRELVVAPYKGGFTIVNDDTERRDKDEENLGIPLSVGAGPCLIGYLEFGSCGSH
jgi:hypothetical protein